jgi:hypothetical protein
MNLIAFAGHPLTQAPQEMHFSGWKTILSPMSSIAPTGHTEAHPMHWMHLEWLISIGMGSRIIEKLFKMGVAGGKMW